MNEPASKKRTSAVTLAMNEERLKRARLSLGGLSIGDAFGEKFFDYGGSAGPGSRPPSSLPPVPWNYTDDTEMSLSIFSILRQFGEINQDQLALSFAEHYDPGRGYGYGMKILLTGIRNGERWQEAVPALFGGHGSYGNGGAMRIAPLGGFFANDMDRVTRQAQLATEATHSHPEASAGAIAVAVAAAYAWRLQEEGEKPMRTEFIDMVVANIPASAVRDGCMKVRELADTDVESVAATVGSGYRITAQDTVPFVIWCAAGWLDNFTEALSQTVRGGGDLDTTCAMVGGIVALYVGEDGIPIQWLKNREPLPGWPFGE